MPNELIKDSAAQLNISGVTLTRVGLVCDGTRTFEDWQQVFAFIRYADSGTRWWIGDAANKSEADHGEKYSQLIDATGLDYQTVANAKWVSKQVEISRRREKLSWEHHKEVASCEPEEQTWLLDYAEQNKLTRAEFREHIRKWRGELAAAAAGELPPGKFRCIVIDPPWPVEKIERECRPNQKRGLDYPVMSLEEIEEQVGKKVREAAAEGCHVYLWVTHRFFPDGLRLFEAWGIDYQCVLTWVKPTAMTPFSWMYNSEHVLFGRIGSLALEKLGIKLAFEAPVDKHSAKPEVFYERVREASPEPRLEMFAREEHEGFTPWGNEAANEGLGKRQTVVG